MAELDPNAYWNAYNNAAGANRQRRNALLEMQDRQREDEERQTRQKAGGILAGGDPTGAANVLYGMGDIEGANNVLQTRQRQTQLDQQGEERARAATLRGLQGYRALPDGSRLDDATLHTLGAQGVPAAIVDALRDGATHQELDAVIQYLGGDVPRPTYQNVSGVGLVEIPPDGGKPALAVAAPERPQSGRYIRGQDNNVYDTTTGEWITGPAPRARPSTARGGRRGGGGRGGARSGGSGDEPAW